MDANDLLEALSEEQLERLRDGEEIEVATRLREPASWEDGPPTSFNSIKLQMTTTGTITDIEDATELAEEFPDVERLQGLCEAWDEYEGEYGGGLP